MKKLMYDTLKLNYLFLLSVLLFFAKTNVGIFHVKKE